MLQPPPLPAAPAPDPSPVPVIKATKVKNAVLSPPLIPHILRVHHDESDLPTHPNETHVIIRRMSLKYVFPVALECRVLRGNEGVSLSMNFYPMSPPFHEGNIAETVFSERCNSSALVACSASV